jgi:hypothetical protein
MKKLLTSLLALSCGIYAAEAKGTLKHGLPSWLQPTYKSVQHAQGKTEATYHKTYSDILSYNGSGYDSSQKNFYTYTSFDSIQTVREQMYDNSSKKFVNAKLLTNTFDASKHRVATHVQAYNGTALTNLTKDTFAFDSHGNMTYTESFKWKGGAWVAVSGTKDAYTYSSTGFVTQVTDQQEDSMGMWTNSYRLDIGRTSAGKITYFVESVSDPSGWIPNDSISGTYFNNDYNKPDSIILRANNGSGTFENQLLVVGTYDASGKPLTQLIEAWFNGSQTWVPIQRETWAYTSKGDPKLNTFESYDINSNSWTVQDGVADSLTYDANGNLSMDENMVFDQNTATWKKNVEIINHYTKTGIEQAAATVSNGINVYPNPAVNDLHITFTSAENNVVVTMYDMAGRMVYQGLSNATQNLTIPVSGLNKGVYSLRIQNGAETTNKLIVKE